MNLVASVLVRDEVARYLKPAVEHLLAFCDEVRVLDDGSSDGSAELLAGRDRVSVLENAGAGAFQDEGAARQRLLEWTLQAGPSHVLAIDADEFVSDGRALRAACETSPAPVLSLTVVEVWKADPYGLLSREDGGWRRHQLPCVWSPGVRRDWRIRSRRLACGRMPSQAYTGRATETGVSLLHFGWTDERDRSRRHGRYARVDRGRFHARAHLDSIMWPDDRCELAPTPWPAGLAAWKPELLAAAGAVQAAA